MRIECWDHEGVDADGMIKGEEGQVEVNPSVKGSWGGPQSQSVKDAGLFIVVSAGRRTDGVVRGMTVYFDSQEELDGFMETGRATAYG